MYDEIVLMEIGGVHSGQRNGIGDESWITAFPEGSSLIAVMEGGPIGKAVSLYVDDIVLRRRAADN